MASPGSGSMRFGSCPPWLDVCECSDPGLGERDVLDVSPLAVHDSYVPSEVRRRLGALSGDVGDTGRVGLRGESGECRYSCHDAEGVFPGMSVKASIGDGDLVHIAGPSIGASSDTGSAGPSSGCVSIPMSGGE